MPSLTVAANGSGLAEGGDKKALPMNKCTNVFRKYKCLVQHRSPAFGKPLLAVRCLSFATKEMSYVLYFATILSWSIWVNKYKSKN